MARQKQSPLQQLVTFAMTAELPAVETMLETIQQIVRTRRGEPGPKSKAARASKPKPAPADPIQQ